MYVDVIENQDAVIFYLLPLLIEPRVTRKRKSTGDAVSQNAVKATLQERRNTLILNVTVTLNKIYIIKYF